MRPSDWFLVDLPSDPTPGDAFGVRSLATKYAQIATIAGEASVGVHRARSSGAAAAWVGDAGDIFRDKSARMPGELAKANDSYQLVADALHAWSSALDDTQSQADRGLAQARQAHAELVAAEAALGSAQRSWTVLSVQQLTYDQLQKQFADVPPPPNVTLPTPDQLRSLSRSSQSTKAALASAHAQVADADARLAAAKAMVLDAKSRRDDAERAAVHAIGEAADRAVQPSSIWEAIQDSAAWQVVVAIATVVLTVLSIVFIIIGGPLVWALIIAATILLMVDCLLSLAQGKDAWGELALLAIGLIPGGRVIGLAGRGVEALGRTGVAGAHIAGTIGEISGGLRRAGNLSMLVSRLFDGETPALSAVAKVIGESAESAVHADSAGAGLLARVFRENFAETLGVNSERFWKNIAGFDMNCTRCVIATDHTLEGAASSAMPLLKGGSAQDVADAFGKSKNDFMGYQQWDTITSKLQEFGPGSRAIVLIDRGFDQVGHVINVVNHGGTVAFIDGQIGGFATLEKNVHELSLLITKIGAR